VTVVAGAIDHLAKPPMRVAYGALISDRTAPSAAGEPHVGGPGALEHIQRVYELCNRNVSETARRLNMHRRTLQRILAKRAPK
jgi:ActR/RegA family two-component response regulator